jgi:hypothetical protein
LVGGDGEGTLHRGKLTRKHVAALDIDRLWFELERYKAERGWYNLNISRSDIASLLDRAIAPYVMSRQGL